MVKLIQETIDSSHSELIKRKITFSVLVRGVLLSENIVTLVFLSHWRVDASSKKNSVDSLLEGD